MTRLCIIVMPDLPRPMRWDSNGHKAAHLFVDVSSVLDDRGIHGFMVDCIDRGLILAPGDFCAGPITATTYAFALRQPPQTWWPGSGCTCGPLGPLTDGIRVPRRTVWHA